MLSLGSEPAALTTNTAQSGMVSAPLSTKGRTNNSNGTCNCAYEVLEPIVQTETTVTLDVQPAQLHVGGSAGTSPTNSQASTMPLQQTAAADTTAKPSATATALVGDKATSGTEPAPSELAEGPPLAVPVTTERPGASTLHSSALTGMDWPWWLVFSAIVHLEKEKNAKYKSISPDNIHRCYAYPTYGRDKKRISKAITGCILDSMVSHGFLKRVGSKTSVYREFAICDPGGTEWVELSQASLKCFQKWKTKTKKDKIKEKTLKKPKELDTGVRCFCSQSHLQIPPEKQVPWTILVLEMRKKTWGDDLRLFFEPLRQVTIFSLPITSENDLSGANFRKKLDDAGIPFCAVDAVIINCHGKCLYWGEQKTKSDTKLVTRDWRDRDGTKWDGEPEMVISFPHSRCHAVAIYEVYGTLASVLVHADLFIFSCCFLFYTQSRIDHFRQHIIPGHTVASWDYGYKWKDSSWVERAFLQQWYLKKCQPDSKTLSVTWPEQGLKTATYWVPRPFLPLQPPGLPPSPCPPAKDTRNNDCPSSATTTTTAAETGTATTPKNTQNNNSPSSTPPTTPTAKTGTTTTPKSNPTTRKRPPNRTNNTKSTKSHQGALSSPAGPPPKHPRSATNLT
ncbi:hypothetical protein Pelo_17533 [Pelomyxa schiedti]|nr:hypothetical protein Pelo_17533 [Pelomyxa schiedti]